MTDVAHGLRAKQRDAILVACEEFSIRPSATSYQRLAGFGKVDQSSIG